jgi:hypothetical protein
MSSPTNTARKGCGPFSVLRRAKNVKNAAGAERNALLDDAERIEAWCAWLVLGAIALEVVVWIAPLCPFLFKLGNAVSDGAVAIGIYGEMRFGHVVSDILKIHLEEAMQRASKADLARVELEKQLRTRSISKEQFEILEKIKGRVSEIRIASDADAEPMWFAHLLGIVVQNIGLKVHLVARSARHKK